MKSLYACNILLVAFILSAGCTANADDGHEQKQEKDNFELEMTATPETLETGDHGKLKITITPHAPWVLKSVTPLEALLSASEGVELDKTKLQAKDIVDKDSNAKTVATGFKVATAGDAKIEADLSFFLCTDEICKRHTAKSEVSVHVK